MSQSEVIECLLRLGGSAKLDDLTNEYNKIHFPRNRDYKYLDINTVKKTQQGDLAKLLRDRIIKRTYIKPKGLNPHSLHKFRKYGYYEITEYGYEYIKKDYAYRLQESQQMRVVQKKLS
ncbi:MAG: hypothetical protein ACM3X1_02625 [Ignavibacteriales bacterium]